MNHVPTREPDLPEAASPDEVEQASLDSFPASDPPAWAPLHIGRPSTAAADTSGTRGAEPADATMTQRVRRGSSRA